MPSVDPNELVLWLAKRKCTARLTIIITGYTADYATHATAHGRIQGPTAGDNVEQTDWRERAPGRLGIAEILLGAAR